MVVGIFACVVLEPTSILRSELTLLKWSELRQDDPSVITNVEIWVRGLSMQTSVIYPAVQAAIIEATYQSVLHLSNA